MQKHHKRRSALFGSRIRGLKKSLGSAGEFFMTDINHFSFTGRVADDAKYSSTKNGTATLSFCLAVNRDRKNNGQWVQKASFFYLTIYGNRASGLCKILAKGTRVGVEGFIEQDSWTDQTGKKQYRTVFCVENLVLLGQAKAHPAEENIPPAVFSAQPETHNPKNEPPAESTVQTAESTVPPLENQNIDNTLSYDGDIW